MNRPWYVFHSFVAVPHANSNLQRNAMDSVLADIDVEDPTAKVDSDKDMADVVPRAEQEQEKQKKDKKEKKKEKKEKKTQEEATEREKKKKRKHSEVNGEGEKKRHKKVKE